MIYKCAKCREEFESDWSEDEANAEALELWGCEYANTHAGMQVVCDDCFQAMTAIMPPSHGYV